MTVRALLFDVDGTLADTEEAHRLAFNQAFLDFRLSFTWDHAEYERLLHVAGGKERLAHYVAELDVPADERARLSALIPALHERKTELFAKMVADHCSPLRPGVARLLDEAALAGIRVGIASTTTRANIEALLAAELGHGAHLRFAVIACGDAVEAKKPSPDVYHLALTALGLSPDEVVAFEDSENGLVAAKRAGLFTVVTPSRWTVSQTFDEADLLLPHLGDAAQPFEGESLERVGGAFLSIERLVALRKAAREGVVRGEPSSVEPQDLTLSEFIIEEQRRSPGATGAFTSLLNGLRLASTRVAALVGQAKRRDVTQQGLMEQASRDVFVRTLELGGSLAAMSSEGTSEPHVIPARFGAGRYLLSFHPLEGSSNVDVNVSVGSLFSVLRAPGAISEPVARHFLQPGSQQVAAGYAIYGPATMLVFTVGRGVNGFTFDRGSGEFVRTHPDLTIPPATRDLAVNSSNARFWEPPVQRYVDECVRGKTGARGEDFAMRWTASLVAEVHRILIRGGLFLYPADTRASARGGRLRLLHEANPMAMLIEQAGGAASTGRGRILDVAPSLLDERVPVVLGSREEVARVERYHREEDEGQEPEFTSPLFNERSLFPTR